jgi:Winged helix DNA-binding domain
VRSDVVTFERDGREFWWSEQPLEPMDDAVPGASLLPGFDEYLLGYKKRGDVLAAEYAGRVVPGGNGIFFPVIVARQSGVGDGQVVGTWQRTTKKTGVAITLQPFFEIDSLEARARAASTRYCTFAGLPLLSLQTRPVS